MFNKNQTTKTLLAILLTVATLLAGSPKAHAQQATPTPHHDSEFVAAINAQRTAHGLAPLEVSATMSAGASNWTPEMIRLDTLEHAPAHSLADGAPANYTWTGENVGRGTTVDSLMTSFMNSAPHRANILNPEFTHIGVSTWSGMATLKATDGLPWVGEVLYTTHRFAAVPTAAPEPTATPTPQPTATPVPQPTATPIPQPTATPIPAPTSTPIPEPTATPIPAPTSTPVPAPTSTPAPAPTSTPAPEPTSTPAPAPTSTPIPAPTTQTTSAPAVLATTPSVYEPEATVEPTAIPTTEPVQTTTTTATTTTATAPTTTATTSEKAATPAPITQETQNENSEDVDFGQVPETLAYADPVVDAAYKAKLKLKNPKAVRGLRSAGN